MVVFDFEYWSRAYEMIPWTRSFTGMWMCSAMPSNAWKSSSFSRMMRLVCNDVVAMVFLITTKLLISQNIFTQKLSFGKIV